MSNEIKPIEPKNNTRLEIGNIVYLKLKIMDAVLKNITINPKFSEVAYSYTYTNSNLGTNEPSPHPYGEGQPGSATYTKVASFMNKEVIIDIEKWKTNKNPLYIDWTQNKKHRISISHLFSELTKVAEFLFSIRYVTSTWKHVTSEVTNTSPTAKSISNNLTFIETKSFFVLCEDDIPENTVDISDNNWSSSTTKIKNNANTPGTFSNASSLSFVPSVGSKILITEIDQLVEKIVTDVLFQIQNYNKVKYEVYTCHYVCHSVCHSNCWCYY